MSTQYVRYPGTASSGGSGVPTYANQASLPASSTDGSLAITTDTDTLWVYNLASVSWVSIGSPSVAFSIGSPANGLSLSNHQLLISTATSGTTGALSSTDWNTFNGKQNALGYTPENSANKGTASGYCPLDASSKVPIANLPSVVMEYQGAWNPSTNSPSLSDGTGTNGYVYYVSTAKSGTVVGLTDPSMTNFQLGDLVIYSSSVTKWQLVTPAAGVQSVNGAQGAVTVNAINQLTGDVTAGPASGSASATSTVVSVGGATASNVASATSTVIGSKTANTVLAAPNGSAGSATFRALVATDVPTLNQNTTGTAANVTGTVAIGNGGTGQTTQQAAINALTGTQSAGKYLRSDGTNATLSTIQAADIPTLNQNTTGTAANVTSTVAIVNGGTGQITANAALNALLPTQTTNGGKYLTTDGTNTSWITSGALTVRSKTANYTILNSDGMVVCDTSGGAFTVTLPNAVGNTGVITRIVLKAAGSILTVASGGGNIGPVSSVVMGTAEDSITVCSDGTNWRIIELNIGMQIKYTAANGTSTANAAFGYPTIVRDVLSWYNTGTGRFTPAYPGTYQINARVYTNGSQNAYIYVNGTLEAQGTGGSSAAPTTVSGIVYLNGSTDYCYIATDTVGATAGGTSLNNLTISRVGN